MRFNIPKVLLLCCSLLPSFSSFAVTRYYLVEDIKNLNLYLWNGPDVKDRMLIGYNLSGGVDFNANTGIICGGVGGASSYLWIANVKTGVKKAVFSSNDLYVRVAPMNNVIISSNDGHCIFTDGKSVYSYSMSDPLSRVVYSGAELDTSEKPRKILFDDKNNITITLFNKHFSLSSKATNESKLNTIHFPKEIKYSLKSLGDFASLSESGDTLYVNASIEDSEGSVDGISAVLLINVQSGIVKKVLLPYVDGVKYKIKQFYIFDNERKIAMLLEGQTKPAWYVFIANPRSDNNSNNSDGYQPLFNKYDAGLEVVQYPTGDNYFYSVTTDNGDLIKIDLSGDSKVTSFYVKDEMNRAVAVSHGDAAYPFVEPKLSSPKKGSAAKVLGDFMICQDLNNAPDKKNCGSARAGVDVVVHEIRKIESVQFVQISPEKDPNQIFWTVIENVQPVN